MSTDVLPLELAQRARALGYPQDNQPQMEWIQADEGRLRHLYHGHITGGIAAPSRLQVLEWLEEEKGVGWWRISSASLEWNWVAWLAYQRETVFAGSIDELIGLVFDQLEKEADHDH